MEALQARITASRLKIARKTPVFINLQTPGYPTGKWGIVDPNTEMINSPMLDKEALRDIYIFPTKSVYGAAVTGVKLSTYRQACNIPKVVGKRMVVRPRKAKCCPTIQRDPYGPFSRVENYALGDRMHHVKASPTKLKPAFYWCDQEMDESAKFCPPQRGPVLCSQCADAKIAQCERREERSSIQNESSNLSLEELAGGLVWHKCMSVKPETTVKNLVKLCRFPAIK